MTRLIAALALHQFGGVALFVAALRHGWWLLLAFAVVWIAGGVLVARMARSDAGGYSGGLVAVISVTGTMMAMASIFGLARGVEFMLTLLVVTIVGAALLAPPRTRSGSH